MGITKDGNGVIVYTPAKNESRNEMSGTVVDDEFAIVDQTNVLKQIQFKITPTDNNPGIATLNVNLGASTTIDLTGGAVDSALVSYTPGFSGNWPFQPTNVKDGLDYVSRHPYGRYRGWVTSASDVNIPLTGFSAGTPIDGVPIQDGDRVFFLNQTNPTENGVWDYDEGSQSFSIDPENPVGLRLRAADLFFVYSGDTYGASLWNLNHTFDIGSGSDQNSFDPVVTKTPTLKVANGATGTFTTTDLKTVTVTNGIITSIV